jgi:hypothetical protein
MMDSDIEDLDAYIAAARQIMKLPLEQEWLGTVRANLEVTLKHALNVEAFPLPDEAEPAFVFEC